MCYEHKGNVRDVQLNMFHLLRKYSSFCVITLLRGVYDRITLGKLITEIDRSKFRT